VNSPYHQGSSQISVCLRSRVKCNVDYGFPTSQCVRIGDDAFERFRQIDYGRSAWWRNGCNLLPRLLLLDQKFNVLSIGVVKRGRFELACQIGLFASKSRSRSASASTSSLKSTTMIRTSSLLSRLRFRASYAMADHSGLALLARALISEPEISRVFCHLKRLRSELAGSPMVDDPLSLGQGVPVRPTLHDRRMCLARKAFAEILSSI
jgi:hypothetical protein